MTIRSKWNEFDKETRKYIKKRDKERCVICGNKGATQIMHIFLNRAQGGKGCKENGCLGCVKCHQIMDNPIGEEQNKLSKEFMKICKNYLIEKEKINPDKEFIDSLKFKMEKIKREPIKIEKEININKCKNCIFLVKNKYNNSSIPTYFCKCKRKIMSKQANACEKYKEPR